MQTLISEGISGLFRGICVDNRDPDGVGRIRVQVPQVLGEYASGWAFPAWSFHDLTIWPQDRLPNVGDGVWIMFESTSPDKMIWIASFGPLDLINQPGFVPEVEYTSTLTITVPPDPQWLGTYTFGGTLGSEGGGVPNPNPVVYMDALPAGETDWVQVAGPFVPDPSDGSISFDYTVTFPGQIEYRLRFDGVGVYGAVNSLSSAADTSVTTTVSALSLPTLYHGNSVNVSGQVEASNGARVEVGTAELQYRSTVGADLNWYTVAGPTNVVDGTFSLTSSVISVLGPTEWRVQYAGGAQYQDSMSAAVAKTVNLKPGPALIKEEVAHTYIAFSWLPVSGATGYDVDGKIGIDGTWTSLATNQAPTTISAGGLSEETSYYFRIRPRALDPGGTDVFGAWSPSLGGNTGRVEVRDTGQTADWITVNNNDMGSWRDFDANQPKGWQAYIRQGRPDDGKVANYFGVDGFPNNAIRDAVRANIGGGDAALGQARQENGYCITAEVQLTKRDDVGVNQTTLTFYVTNIGPGATGTQTPPKPEIRGTAQNRQSGPDNSTEWYGIGAPNGQRLGDGTDRSVLLYRGGTSNYCAFSGGAGAGPLRIKWGWDYATVSYIAPSWVT